MAIGRDITERRRLEEQLRQAQKMEAVGRLAGGVAHDFNNILTAIQGQCELLLQLLEPKAPARRHGELILRAAARAASLTGQLLAFSRKQVLQPRVLDLNQIIADLKAMLSTLIGESIEFVTELDPSLPRVKADPSQLEQVIVNLLVNARDAMPDGGRLTVRTINSGGQAQLEVRDTGVGMDAETLPRIFEPFFTTKKPRKGTGLGLSMAYGIVAQSGGTITAESAPGQGALFRVTLPPADGALEPSVVPAPGPAPRGHETVLLVEDDGDVRQFLFEVLESHGYRVLAARDGVEAVKLAEREPRGAELLLTDVVMPRMSGPEVAERLRPLWPPMKVLFISGYAEQSLGAPGAALLKKPFTVLELLRRVRAVLDAAT
jgi:CheY-like chemotaxis protein